LLPRPLDPLGKKFLKILMIFIGLPINVDRIAYSLIFKEVISWLKSPKRNQQKKPLFV